MSEESHVESQEASQEGSLVEANESLQESHMESLESEESLESNTESRHTESTTEKRHDLDEEWWKEQNKLMNGEVQPIIDPVLSGL